MNTLKKPMSLEELESKYLELGVKLNKYRREYIAIKKGQIEVEDVNQRLQEINFVLNNTKMVALRLKRKLDEVNRGNLMMWNFK